MGFSHTIAGILGLVDSPEYLARKATPFVVPHYTVSQIRAAVPKHLHARSNLRGTAHWALSVGFVAVFFVIGAHIDWVSNAIQAFLPSYIPHDVVKWVCYGIYWWWQGLAFAGFITFGHECAHGSLFSHTWMNDIAGFPLMTFVFMPYYSWQTVHGVHHKTTSSVERDEVYVPQTRLEYGSGANRELPSTEASVVEDTEWSEEGREEQGDTFADVPIILLSRLIIMQLIGMQFYLATNAMGNPRHPPLTDHFSPDSSLFRPSVRNKIIITDVGLLVNVIFLYAAFRARGMVSFVNLYLIPYLVGNHWMVALTYLNHTCPTVPHYRKESWTFVRGALATADRPFLGWVGRVFLHNAAHDHIAHHLFSRTPFYNQPQITIVLKELLGPSYTYDSTPVLRALYRSFTQCHYVDDAGDIVFYKNKWGRQQRQLAELGAVDKDVM